MPKLLVIYNDASGNGNAKSLRPQIEKELKLQGLPAEVIELTNPIWRHKVDLAVGRGNELVVAAGGDGTVNAVASLLTGSSTVLGVLPVGTLNHFAHDAGIPASIPEAVKVLSTGINRKIDTGQVNGRIFLNNSSIGLYPQLVKRRSRRNWFPNKQFASLLAALELIRGDHSMAVKLTVDGATRIVKSPFIFVGNNDYEIQRFGFSNRSSLRRGRICVYVIHQSGPWGLFKIAVRAFLGLGHPEKSFDASTGISAEALLKRPTVDIALDGEITEMSTPISWNTWPRSLNVRLPK